MTTYLRVPTQKNEKNPDIYYIAIYRPAEIAENDI